MNILGYSELDRSKLKPDRPDRENQREITSGRSGCYLEKKQDITWHKDHTWKNVEVYATGTSNQAKLADGLYDPPQWANQAIPIGGESKHHHHSLIDSLIIFLDVTRSIKCTGKHNETKVYDVYHGKQIKYICRTGCLVIQKVTENSIFAAGHCLCLGNVCL